jgi:hypothetical protein
VPLLPGSIIDPLWVGFAALIGVDEQPEFSMDYPWGCHHRRITARMVFDHVIAALVHGSGYERIATRAARTAPSAVGWPRGPRPGTDPRCCGSAWPPTTA